MSVRDNPKNYTYQLMRAQEERILQGKISSMKAQVDNKTPKRFSHIKHKSAQLKKESIRRLRQIETENNSLLLKMLDIMQVQRGIRSSSNSPSFQRSKMATSQSIHHMSKYLSQANTPTKNILSQSLNGLSSSQQLGDSPSQKMHSDQSSRLHSPLKVGSLNFYQRKKDQSQINENNKQLVKALHNVQPVIKRDELKHHENRIKKLRDHIGQVRYGTNPNFVYPLVSHENHNFHSSQFLFVKHPMMLNLVTPTHKRKKSVGKLLIQTYLSDNPLMMSQKMRRKTSQGVRSGYRDRLKFNQSADFSKMRLISNQTPSQKSSGQQMLINTSFQQQPQRVKQPPKTPMATTGGSHDDIIEGQKQINLMEEKLKLKQATRSKGQITSNNQGGFVHQNRKLKSSQSRENSQQKQKEVFSMNKKQLEIISNYTQVPNYFQAAKKQSTPQTTKDDSNPYKQHNLTKQKFVAQRPESSNGSRVHIPSVNMFNNFSVESQKNQLENPIEKQSTMKFVAPKIQINCVMDEDEKQAFNHNQLFQLNKDCIQHPNQQSSYDSQNSPISPDFKVSTSSPQNPTNLSPQRQQKLSFDFDQKTIDGINTDSANHQEESQATDQHTVNELADYQRQNRNSQAKDQRHEWHIIVNNTDDLNDNRLSPIRVTKTKENVYKFINKVKGGNRRSKIDDIVKRYISKLKMRVQAKRQQKAQNNQTHAIKNINNSDDSAAYESDSFEEPSKDMQYSSNQFKNIPSKQNQGAFKRQVTKAIGLQSNKLAKKEVDEKVIITKCQKIFLSIRRQLLKAKVQHIVRRFISILRDRVSEKNKYKQIKQSLGIAFQRQITKVIQSNNQSPAKSNKVAKINVPKSQLNPAAQNLKFKTEILTKYNALSNRQRHLLSQFFDLMWKKQRIRALKLQFVATLKQDLQYRRDAQELIKKNIAKNIKQIMLQDFHKFQRQNSSISFRYTTSEESIQNVNSDMLLKQVPIIKIINESSEKQLLSNMRSNVQQQKTNKSVHFITNEKKAKENAVLFYYILRQNLQRSQRINGYVRKFVNIMKGYRKLKSNVQSADKFNNDLGVQKKESNTLKFHQELKSQTKSIKISEISDPTFREGLSQDYKRFFVKLFQRNKQQRSSKIHSIYLGQAFRNSLFQRLRQYYQTLSQQKSLNEFQKQQCQSIQSFVHINNIKDQYMKEKGQMKAKEYVKVLYGKVQRKRNILRNIIAMGYSKPLKIADIKDARFQNTIMKDFKIVFAKLFQMTAKQRSSRIHTIYLIQSFKQKLNQRIQTYFEQQSKKQQQPNEQMQQLSQIEKYLLFHRLRVRYLKKRGKALFDEYLLKLRRKAKERKLKDHKNYILRISEIEDQQFKSQLRMNFNYLVAKMFQRNYHKRQSRVHMVYIWQTFNQNFITLLKDSVLKLQKSNSLRSQVLVENIKKFLQFEEKRLKFVKMKAILKIKAYFKRLQNQVFQKKYKELKKLIVYSLIRKPFTLSFSTKSKKSQGISSLPTALNQTSMVKKLMANAFQKKPLILKPEQINTSGSKIQPSGQKQNQKPASLLGQIEDKQFQKACMIEGRKLFAKLFMRKHNQRKSKIYLKCLISKFKDRIIEIVKDYYQTQSQQDTQTSGSQELLNQIKVYLLINSIKEKDMKEKGKQKIKNLSDALYKRAKSKKQNQASADGKPPLRSITKLLSIAKRMKSKVQNTKQQKSFNLSQIQNDEFQDSCRKLVSKIFAKFLQMKSQQRKSKYFAIYLSKQFKLDLLEIVNKYYQKASLSAKNKEEIEQIQLIKAYLLINKIMNKQLEKQGISKAKEFINKLHNQVIAKKIHNKSSAFRGAISRILSNAKTNKNDQVQQSGDGFNLSKVQDVAFQQGYQRDFRLLFAKLFQLNEKQRQSAIYPYYFAKMFKERIVTVSKELLTKLQSKQKSSQEDQELKHIQAFICINELRNKYLQKRGIAKAKSLIKKLHDKVKNNKKFMKNSTKSLGAIQRMLIKVKTRRQDKTSKSKLYWEQHGLNLSLIPDPQFQQCYQQDFKKLLVQLFQLNKKERQSAIFVYYFAKSFKDNLLNRVTELVTRKLKGISQINDEQLQYLQGQLQINELKDKYLKKRGILKAKDYIKKLRDQVIAKKGQRNSLLQITKKVRIKSQPLEQKSFNIAKISDRDFKESYNKDFKRLFVKIFQLSPKQRSSLIYAYYFARDFKEQLIQRVRQYYRKLEAKLNMNEQEKEELEYIKAFLYINDLKVSYLKKKAITKVKALISKLHLKVKMKGRLVGSISRIMNKAKNSKQNKTQQKQQGFDISKIEDLQFTKSYQASFRRLLAKLFQMRSDQRRSEIYPYYFAYDFKAQLLQSVKQYFEEFKTQAKSQEEKDQLNHIQSFLYINELRNKYLRQRGIDRARLYLQALRKRIQQRKVKESTSKQALSHLMAMLNRKLYFNEDIVEAQQQQNLNESYSIESQSSAEPTPRTLAKNFAKNMFSKVGAKVVEEAKRNQGSQLQQHKQVQKFSEYGSSEDNKIMGAFKKSYARGKLLPDED